MFDVYGAEDIFLVDSLLYFYNFKVFCYVFIYIVLFCCFTCFFGISLSLRRSSSCVLMSSSALDFFAEFFELSFLVV